MTDVFTELEILSMVEENDKICIRDGKIAIERKGHPITVAVRRWLHNDSRKGMITEVGNIINRAISMSKESHDDWVKFQFYAHFKKVIKGLDNIKKTYFDDSSVVARLNVIIMMLDEIIKKMSTDKSIENASTSKRPNPTPMEDCVATIHTTVDEGEDD
jgi:hypothetical protein